MSSEFIELVKNNPDLPIFAWVEGEVCEDSCGYWLGEFSRASIREYAKVETYDWYERNYVFRDDYEEYLEYLLNEEEDLTEEEAINIIENHLDYKKAIFVDIHTPSNF